MFIIGLLTLLLASIGAYPQTGIKAPQCPNTQQELINLNQELIDALAGGDKTVADRIYAADFVRITTQGGVLTKAQVLNALKPAAGGVKITYESKDIQAFDYGDAAVLVYLSIRHTNNNGEQSDFYYRVTDTFVKREGRWQKAVSAGTPIQQ